MTPDPKDILSRATTCHVCDVERPVQGWEPVAIICTRSRGCLNLYRGDQGWEALADPDDPRAWCPDHAPSKAVADRHAEQKAAAGATGKVGRSANRRNGDGS